MCLRAHLILSNNPFPSDFSAKTLYNVSCPIRAGCPSHLTLVEIIILISGQNYQ